MGQKYIIFSIILGVSLIASIFALNGFDTSTFTASAHGSWQTISPGSVAIKSKGPQNFELSLSTTVPIPNTERFIFAGFGWLYADGTSAYVVTTHNGVKDSKQNPNGWHAHNVSFTPASGASITHCITSISDDTTAGIIKNQGNTNKLVVQGKTKDTTSTFKTPATAVSFDIIPDPTCTSGVGIGVHQTVPAPPPGGS